MSSSRERRSFLNRLGCVHRLLRLTGRVGLSLLMVITLAGCVGKNSGAEASKSPTLPYVRPPGGGGVTVVGKGFSVIRDPYRGTHMSYGVVFENTSKLIAHKTSVVIRILDASGRQMGHPRLNAATTIEHQVWYVRPGERFGIGHVMQIERADVDRVEVSVGASEWWPLTATAAPFPKIDLSDVRIERRGSHRIRPRFTVNSHHSMKVNDLCVNIVFRDNRGEIVGGAVVSMLDSPSSSPGEMRREMRMSGKVTHGVPENFDPARSDLYATTSGTSCFPGP